MTLRLKGIKEFSEDFIASEYKDWNLNSYKEEFPFLSISGIISFIFYKSDYINLI